jgi:hypothetical protein
MPLAECRECTAEVSTEALTCPRCGVPDPARDRDKVPCYSCREPVDINSTVCAACETKYPAAYSRPKWLRRQRRAPSGDWQVWQTVSLVGAVAVGVGVFLPLIRAPIVGSLTYFGNGFGEGVLLLLLMGLAIVFIVMDRPRLVFIPGGLSAVLLVWFLLKFNAIVADLRRGIPFDDLGPFEEFADELDGFQQFAEALAASVGLEWGFGVLALGTLVLLIGAYVGSREPG